MLFSAIFRHSISKYSDSELLDMVRKNNRRAEGEIFKRYSILVMGLCLKYMKNYEKAEDMMMSVFEKLPAKIEKHEIGNLKNWLYSVVRNECLMSLRKKNINGGEIDHALLSEKDDSLNTLKMALLRDKKLTLLEEALPKLKPSQQQALTYFYLDRKSYDQVAIIMKQPVKKIKSLIQNGKRNLKLILEQEDDFQE